MSDRFIIRVQSPYGTRRVELTSSDSTETLYQKVRDAFDLSGFNFALYKDRNNKTEIFSSRSKILTTYKLKHGDMVFLHPMNGTGVFSRESTVQSRRTSSTSVGSAASSNTVVEDDVDKLLKKLDGRIERPRDERLCSHGANGKCVHCSPLEPYDEQYLKEHNVKHMSFHTYLRKLTGGVDKGKFAILENLSCKIKAGCKDHPPWPKGICSKCQPNAVTLNRQVYRHVDNVMFENPQLVERFLNYWRTTGHQRLGLLYGRYELHKDVPLGIKATVAAIYEPPQESSRDTISLLPDDRATEVDQLAAQLGLHKVGWIFTDLIADDIQRGTVKHFRNVSSHFLSAQECIMAGDFQNTHPNPCRLSPDGFFGSKFVTVIVTGDVENQVHMEGYQVSNQCMALVRDDCLVPTRDAPELGYVKESSNEQYVPDVFYKEKDGYGNEVTQLARPLPIEYLLVDVPASTPVEPQFTFAAREGVTAFPVENRLIDGHIQDFTALSSYLQQFTPSRFLEAVSDFHFLVYIATMDTLPLKEYLSPLLDAVRNKDEGLAHEWGQSEQWATVEQLIAANSNASMTSQQLRPSGGEGGAMWTCSRCTYNNEPTRTICEICSQAK